MTKGSKPIVSARRRGRADPGDGMTRDSPRAPGRRAAAPALYPDFRAAGVCMSVEACLRPSWFIDSDDPAVADFARRAAGGATEPRAKALKVFYAVRDGILYDPYGIH